jgi:hypothetical protein
MRYSERKRRAKRLAGSIPAGHPTIRRIAMSIGCEVCGKVDNGTELFRCDVCDKVYCAACLVRYGEAMTVMASNEKVDDATMKLLEILNSCPGCKGLTMELWDDEEFVDQVRTPEEIHAAAEEYFQKLWYYRCKHRGDHETSLCLTPTTPEIQAQIDKQCQEIESKFPKEELPPWNAYQYAEVCGKLSALRWVLGYEWDMLDT